MALNYLDKAAWDAGVYKDKGNDDDTQQDTSSEDSGYSASGILSAAKNFSNTLPGHGYCHCT